jgi:Tfp pilus assembly protein PilP
VVLAVIVASMLLAAPACEDAATPPPTPPAQPANQTPPPAETPIPTVVAEEEEDYVRPEYPNSNRRNPFQPDPDVVEPRGTVDEGSVRQLDPLEQFGIGQLELIAIISEVAVPKAMFLSPDGFGHVVKEGDRVGRNAAIITDIRDNEVELTETPDAEEGGQTTTRVVQLADRQLSTSDDELSEEDREALRRLLQSEEGIRALRETARKEFGGSDQGSPPPSASGANTNDPRFGGFAPPSQGE